MRSSAIKRSMELEWELENRDIAETVSWKNKGQGMGSKEKAGGMI